MLVYMLLASAVHRNEPGASVIVSDTALKLKESQMNDGIDCAMGCSIRSTHLESG